MSTAEKINGKSIEEQQKTRPVAPKNGIAKSTASKALVVRDSPPEKPLPSLPPPPLLLPVSKTVASAKIAEEQTKKTVADTKSSPPAPVEDKQQQVQEGAPAVTEKKLETTTANALEPPVVEGDKKPSEVQEAKASTYSLWNFVPSIPFFSRANPPVAVDAPQNVSEPPKENQETSKSEVKNVSEPTTSTVPEVVVPAANNLAKKKEEAQKNSDVKKATADVKIVAPASKVDAPLKSAAGDEAVKSVDTKATITGEEAVATPVASATPVADGEKKVAQVQDTNAPSYSYRDYLPWPFRSAKPTVAVEAPQIKSDSTTVKEETATVPVDSETKVPEKVVASTPVNQAAPVPTGKSSA